MSDPKPAAVSLATINDHVLIALQHESGTISRMQLGTYRRYRHLGGPGAARSGFTLNADGDWVTEASDTAIAKEIAKTKWGSPVVKWWRINDGDAVPERHVSPPAVGSTAARLAELERKLAALMG